MDNIKNDIKKALYKEKPIAYLDYVRKGKLNYHCDTELGKVSFEVDINDIGDADFFPQMSAQLLIRYIAQ